MSTSTTADLAALWVYIAETACRGYSPLYERICLAVAESEAVLELVQESPPTAHNPILLLAVVHDVLLSGVDHPLAAVYGGESDADPGPLFIDVCLEQRQAVLERLATRQVNTNEVGRSAIIGPALTEVAARFGGPVGLVDVGCSAGMNLLCDRYRLDYGPVGVTGPVDAPVEISCEVVGGSPPIAASLPPIVARVGLDREPIDVTDPRQRRWQLACTWPDTGRLARTTLALDEAGRTPLRLVQGDAVESVGELIAELPADATAVVTTTWVVAYFSREQRAGFHEALATASASRPVAWISAETQGVVEAVPAGELPSWDNVEPSVLGLVTFDSGQAEGELLGYVHPHGSTLDWRAS